MLDLEHMFPTSTKLHIITYSILFLHLFDFVYIVNDIISGKYKNTVIVNNRKGRRRGWDGGESTGTSTLFSKESLVKLLVFS